MPRAYLWITLGLNLALAGLGLLAFIHLGLLFDAASTFIIFSAIISSLVSSALIEIDRAAKAREQADQRLRETAGLVAGGLAATAYTGDLASPPATRVDQAALTRLLATELASHGELSPALGGDDIETLARAVPNRDVGMVHVSTAGEPDHELAEAAGSQPASVRLLATSKLRDFLAANDGLPTGQRRYLDTLCQVVASHHERWDGGGYPEGLAGDDIPLPGRIAAIVDAYDSLVSERPYRPAHSHEEAVAIIESEAGTRFDPRLVVCFRRVAGQAVSAS